MGQMHHEIPENLIDWIPKQHVFWVASAPLSADGHVNISPKGVAGTFHVVNSRRVWYEDLSGTGAETVAHIRENGRVTILFNAFEGPPRIVRLYGKGTIYELGTPEYDALLPADKRQPGSRAVIALDVFKVATTCGYAVPYYQFVGHRMQLNDWAAKREAADKQGEASSIALPSPYPSQAPSSSLIALQDPNTYNSKGMKHWWMTRNVTSLDGLPAFTFARKLLTGFTGTREDATGVNGNITVPSTPKVHISAGPPVAVTSSPTQTKHQHRRPANIQPLGSSNDDIVLRPFKSGIISSGTQEEDQREGSLLLAAFAFADTLLRPDLLDIKSDLAQSLGKTFQKIMPLFLAFLLGMFASQITTSLDQFRPSNLHSVSY